MFTPKVIIIASSFVLAFLLASFFFVLRPRLKSSFQLQEDLRIKMAERALKMLKVSLERGTSSIWEDTLRKASGFEQFARFCIDREDGRGEELSSKIAPECKVRELIQSMGVEVGKIPDYIIEGVRKKIAVEILSEYSKFIIPALNKSIQDPKNNISEESLKLLSQTGMVSKINNFSFFESLNFAAKKIFSSEFQEYLMEKLKFDASTSGCIYSANNIAFRMYETLGEELKDYFPSGFEKRGYISVTNEKRDINEPPHILIQFNNIFLKIMFNCIKSKQCEDVSLTDNSPDSKIQQATSAVFSSNPARSGIDMPNN